MRCPEPVEFPANSESAGTEKCQAGESLCDLISLTPIFLVVTFS